MKPTGAIIACVFALVGGIIGASLNGDASAQGGATDRAILSELKDINADLGRKLSGTSAIEALKQTCLNTGGKPFDCSH